MPQHTTISGQKIDYAEPSPKLAAILTRLARMADDPKATENDMIEIAFSKDNPLLGPDIFPSRGAVTRDTLSEPAYHVIRDLLARKQIAEQNLKIEDLAAEYTLSVVDAAERLGIHENALRLAIRSFRLPVWLKNGQYFLSPRAVEVFEVGTRGPQPKRRLRSEPLVVRVGNSDGKSFRIRYPGELEETDKPGPHVVEGQIPRWRRVGIISGGAGHYRFFALEPSDAEEEVKYGQFFVRGKFKVSTKINNSDEAHKAWKSFEAA